MGRRIIEKLNIDKELLDTTLWPTVLIENLSPENRKLFLERKKLLTFLFPLT